MSKEILIYLYSNFSKACNDAKPKIAFLTKYLRILSVCIDSKKIRKMITNSKKIKIEYVPCLLILNENGRMEVYENEQFSNAVDNLHKVFTEQKQQEEQMAKQKQEEQIMQQIQTQQQAQIQAQQSHQQVQQQAQVIPQMYSEEEDFVPPPNKVKNVTNLNAIQNAKNKIGKTKFKLDKSVHPFSDDNMIMTVQRDRPEKGVGHHSLAISSLPEIGLDEKRKSPPVKMPSYTEQDEDEDVQEEILYNSNEPEDDYEEEVKTKKAPVKPVKIGKNKVEMLEDFTGLLDDSIDINEMRGAPPKRDEKTMKMDTVKKAAEQMMREREMAAAESR
jgi:hypothetical protein